MFGWLKTSKPKQRPRAPEESLLAEIPADWAGPLTVIVGSFAFFFVCWFLIAKRPTSERLSTKHRLQSAEHSHMLYDPKSGQSHRIFKSELATRILSTVHAFICCFGAARSLNVDKNITVDTMWHTSAIARVYFSISIAYFAGCIIIGVVAFRNYGVLYFVHAVAAFLSLAVLVFTQRFHYYGCVGLLWEASSPFLNARWFLREYGIRSRLLASANSLALAIVFGTTRVLFGAPLLYLLWSQLSDARGAGRIGRAHFTLLTALIATLTAVNLVWFYYILAALWRGGATTAAPLRAAAPPRAAAPATPAAASGSCALAPRPAPSGSTGRVYYGGGGGGGQGGGNGSSDGDSCGRCGAIWQRFPTALS